MTRKSRPGCPRCFSVGTCFQSYTVISFVFIAASLAVISNLAAMSIVSDPCTALQGAGSAFPDTIDISESPFSAYAPEPWPHAYAPIEEVGTTPCHSTPVWQHFHIMDWPTHEIVRKYAGKYATLVVVPEP